ncbi:hypothetical protein [Nocardioides sp. AE5]|uniref:hypothetical protein n=1 Tax=Nocardioides sp. AE5 TaxID=2962573 RepID=UPI002882A150|nr:hypothetical protein [Nocardioides sp. AE5]MDT0201018.1 hypothetical protein [Nocardioides sp. AE5]
METTEPHPNAPELVSARQASSMLGTLGISRQSARRALLAGIAGRPIRSAGALLYREDRVRSLVKPALDPDALPPPLHNGVIVGALTTGPDLGVPARATSQGMKTEVNIALITAALLRFAVKLGHPIPYVATVAGFVVAGAEVAGIAPVDAEQGHVARRSTNNAGVRVRLALRPPGDWYAAIHLERLAVPSGTNLSIHPRDACFMDNARRHDQRGVVTAGAVA